MKATRVRALCCLSTSLLLVAAPAASAASGGFELRLGDTPTAERLRLDLEESLSVLQTGDAAEDSVEVPGALTPQEPVPDLAARTRWAAWTASQEQAPTPQTAPKRTFGRWLKKYWWVAVLGAAAVGFAVEEDDSGGKED